MDKLKTKQLSKINKMKVNKIAKKLNQSSQIMYMLSQSLKKYINKPHLNK